MPFCQELGKSASELFRVTKHEYGEEPVGRSADFKWLLLIKLGKEYKS
jgi:hypothetical protein